MPGPQPSNDGFHPLYNVEQKRHLTQKQSDEYQWKSTSRKIDAPVGRDRPEGKAFPNTKFTDIKDYHERRHMPDRDSRTEKTYDDAALTKVCFEQHNKRTTQESVLEKVMT